MDELVYYKFKDLVFRLRDNKYSLYSQSNITYRNGSKIMEIFGFILKQKNQDSSLSKTEALSLGMNRGPSYWAQVARFVQEFNFVDKSFTDKTTEFKLNDNGIRLMNRISTNFTSDELINWKNRSASRDLPNYVKEFYHQIFINISLDNVTEVLKTCFCALLASCDKNLYKQIRESDPPTSEEKLIANTYFDLSPGTRDLKWIGWIAAILQDLGLVKPIDNTNFFELSDIGSQVISKTVQHFKGELLATDIIINDNVSTNIIEHDKLENLQKPNRKYRPPNITERKGLVTSRVGQGWFRQELINRWDGKCSVTNCSIPQILIASHIIPWSESSDENRLNPGNGLLLSPNLDALFDKHLISFQEDKSILISKKINIGDIALLGIVQNMKLRFICDDMLPFLKHHREKFFRND